MADSNQMFEQFRKDFDAAMAREVQIRTNYEQGLIPSLERDLQAARESCASLTKERDELLAWKKRADAAWVLVEQGEALLRQATAVAPSPNPPSPTYDEDGEKMLPPSWRS